MPHAKYYTCFRQTLWLVAITRKSQRNKKRCAEIGFLAAARGFISGRRSRILYTSTIPCTLYNENQRIKC